MSESDGPSERDAIREKKREELREKLEDDGSEDAPVHVDGNEHLQELIEDNRVVLVDFYADWCGPCKMLEPTVEAIAESTEALVAKVDIDQHQEIAAGANVRGVPTLVLYADGEAVERLVGVQEEDRLRSLVEEHGA